MATAWGTIAAAGRCKLLLKSLHFLALFCAPGRLPCLAGALASSLHGQLRLTSLKSLGFSPWVRSAVTAQVWVSSDLEFPQQDFGLLHEGGNEVPALLSSG